MENEAAPEKIAGIPADKAREIIEERKSLAQANRVPFPGALRQAFSVAPDIEVGPFSVRPFYDGDLELLQSINHPLAAFAFADEKAMDDIKIIRGQTAWDLCYLMTTPAQRVGEMLESPNGLETFKKEAKKTFSIYQLGDLIAIQRAVFEQFNNYFATIQGFEETFENGTKKKQS